MIERNLIQRMLDDIATCTPALQVPAIPTEETMSKKRYPDMRLVRKQSHIACNAIRALAEFGVEIVSISFRHPHPLIEVAHCPGVEQIRHHLKGQGHNDSGRYIRKVAHVKGCQVEWNEAQA